MRKNLTLMEVVVIVGAIFIISVMSMAMYSAVKTETIKREVFGDDYSETVYGAKVLEK